MGHVDANGLRFHVQVVTAAAERDGMPGKGSPREKVVMIHGLVAENLSSYYYTLANPVGMVADAYLYDLRGHGRSEVPESGYTVADHIEDLRLLLDAWSLHQPVHLVGNGFGGLIALTFAHQYPERVTSLVLIEAHFRTGSDTDSLTAAGIVDWGDHVAGSLALAAFGLAERGMDGWVERYGSRKLNRLAQHAGRLLSNTSIIEDLDGEQPASLAALHSIDLPTLAIYGEGSDVLDRGEELERHLPQCELHVVPDCNHSVLFEATPYVREQVLLWLDRIADPGCPLAERGT